MKSDINLLLAVIIGTFIFAVDLYIPLGVAFGVSYILVILITLQSPIKHAVIYSAVITSALVLLGLYFSPEGSELWKVYFNRALSVFVIWVVATLGLYQNKLKDKFKYQASHDSLTGLSNRQVMEQRLNGEIERASRYKHNLSVFMLDIDHFKSINDTYGHLAGDAVLKNFATILESSLRNSDYVARYGGEEFVVVLPETTFHEAEELAERVRLHIAEYHFPLTNDKGINLTTSIGIASFPEHAQSLVDLLKAADSAMYVAKEAGRNQVKTA